MPYVQAFISNNSFPTSIEELRRMAPRFDMEQLLGVMTPDEIYDDCYSCASWTAPTWCKNGDIVFYMHSKTAIHKITKLTSELIKCREEFEEEEFWFLLNSLRRAKTIWNAYGGKIFAVGCIAGGPEYYKSEEDVVKHWRSNIYAPVKSIFVLEKPIDASELYPRIKISMTGSITPVYGESFIFLRDLVTKKNSCVRKFLLDALPQAIPLTKASDDNWISVSGQYRREFSTAMQYRKYYTDFLLKDLCDIKNVYAECLSNKEGKSCAYIDNIIRFHKKNLMVRIVLSVLQSKGLFSRLRRYNSVDEVVIKKKNLDTNDFWRNAILVIDTQCIYLYSALEDSLFKLFDLDRLETYSEIETIKSVIAKALNNPGTINIGFSKITPDMMAVDPDDDLDYEIEMDGFDELDEFDWDDIDPDDIEWDDF